MLKRILFAASIALVASQAHADSFNVYVGYADSLRANGFFPNPFCSTQNSTTCQIGPANNLDSGAIRIQNTGSDPLSITNIVVQLPGVSDTFTLWNDFTIAPGQNGFIGQTAAYNFDTSDYDDFFSSSYYLPGFGVSTNGIGGCSLPSTDLTDAGNAACAANFPIISFNENGNTVTCTDSGSIINTGGEDFVNFSGDGNESIGWQICGSTVVNRNGNNAPEPFTLSLFGAGLAGAAALRRRRRKTA